MNSFVPGWLAGCIKKGWSTRCSQVVG